VHHALMDGLHVGRFLETLQGRFGDPAGELGASPNAGKGSALL
jgi:hypothetical protein